MKRICGISLQLHKYRYKCLNSEIVWNVWELILIKHGILLGKLPFWIGTIINWLWIPENLIDIWSLYLSHLEMVDWSFQKCILQCVKLRVIIMIPKCPVEKQLIGNLTHIVYPPSRPNWDDWFSNHAKFWGSRARRRQYKIYTTKFFNDNKHLPWPLPCCCASNTQTISTKHSTLTILIKFCTW